MQIYLQSMRKFQTQQVAETTLSNAQESATVIRQEAMQRVMEQRTAPEAEARAADEAARQMLAQAQESAAAENAETGILPSLVKRRTYCMRLACLMQKLLCRAIRLSR